MVYYSGLSDIKSLSEDEETTKKRVKKRRPKLRVISLNEIEDEEVIICPRVLKNNNDYFNIRRDLNRLEFYGFVLECSA